MVTKTSFGALPIQRVGMQTAKSILRSAYDAGINFFDTARAYTDSEEKLGATFGGSLRQNIIIASKTMSTDRAGAQRDIETTLRNLRTDYVDIYQLHNLQAMQDPKDDTTALYALMQAKKEGKIRHVSFTAHRRDIAEQGILSGLFDTLQFPLSYLSAESDLELVRMCQEHDMGFIAMKAMSGGLCSSAKAAFAYQQQFENVVPIYGIQRQEELEEWLSYERTLPTLDDELQAIIQKERAEFAGEFCRACGYCMPCPVGIQIPTVARLHLLCTRSPYQSFITDEYYESLKVVDDCLHCGQCSSRCPYQMDVPSMIRKQYDKYLVFYKEHKEERK